MATAIAVDGIGKRYRIGQFRAAYGTLRDSLAQGAKRVASGHLRQSLSEFWALDGTPIADLLGFFYMVTARK